MRTKILYILFIGLIGSQINAQSLNAYLDAMEDALFYKDYYNAFHYANTALEFDEERIDLLHNHAEAARLYDAYTVAEQSYFKVVEKDNSSKYPKALFYLSEMQQRIGKYDEAKMNYALYLSQHADIDEYLTTKANKELKAIEWAKMMIDKEDPNADVQKLEGEVNSPYSDFGALSYNDQLYYSSLRFEEGESLFNPSNLISKILIEGEAQPSEEINTTNLHTAHTSFDKTGERMFYTLCSYENSYDIRCDIYYRKITDEGYGEAVKLPDHINNSEFTNTQPNIGYDPVLDKEVLYFVSNRTGGKGKLDIWFSVIDNEEFGLPQNLTKLNTNENDITPFYHSSSNTLYFSSDGYQSLGGYDIYFSEDLIEGFTTPENLGMPYNSSFNDVYYSLNETGSEAMFSSNRYGSLYLEESFEACCYDIYKANINSVEIYLNALSFISTTGDELKGATVTVIDAKTGELFGPLTNDEDNDHIFKIESNREYTIIADKDGFKSDTVLLNTTNVAQSDTLIRKLYLEPTDVIILDLNVFDQQSLASLEGATVRVECMEDPDRVMVKTNDGGNDFTFELPRDCKYKVTISKPGYQSQTIIIDPADNPDGGVISRKVYLVKDKIIPAYEDLNLYLPVMVYYDNDDPDKRNYSLTSSTNYTDSYYPYYAKKDEFKRRYAKTLKGDLAYNAKVSVEQFFENELRPGYEDLQLFISKLLESLQNGNNFELTIRGHASPRAKKKYNLALGQRRISNIINELKDYGGGALKSYFDNGQLSIKQISFGEELSRAGVSDSHPNERLSIYSPDACRERRSELISINRLN